MPYGGIVLLVVCTLLLLSWVLFRMERRRQRRREITRRNVYLHNKALAQDVERKRKEPEFNRTPLSRSDLGDS